MQFYLRYDIQSLQWFIHILRVIHNTILKFVFVIHLLSVNLYIPTVKPAKSLSAACITVTKKCYSDPHKITFYSRREIQYTDKQYFLHVVWRGSPASGDSITGNLAVGEGD